MINVDGGFGEGGGQILRYAVSYSALSGKPVRVENIRAGRDKPGLRPQHQKAVEAAAKMCDAQVSGVKVGSCEIEFTPSEIRPGRFRVDVGTAGSVTLVLQALLPIALCAEEGVVLEVSGGTDVRWSPTYEYFKNVFLENIGLMGCEVEADIVKRGFYPKGGGKVIAKVEPWSQKRKLEAAESDGVGPVSVVSAASHQLKERKVAQRQVKGFLKEVSPHLEVGPIVRDYAVTDSVGTTFTAYARKGPLMVGACGLGDKGVPAEEVGRNVAKDFLAEASSKSLVDVHMGDQLVPYVSLAGGKVTVSKVTEHARAAAYVAKLFGYMVHAELDTIFNDITR